MIDGAIELESRRAIYQEIADSPGIHFRALLDALSYAQGTLQYHLRQLADEDLIDVSDDGKYTRYYPAADFDEAEQTMMNALRREYSRRILAHLLADGPLSTTDLSDRLDKAQSTTSWQLSKLADADLVAKERDGRSVVYEVTNPDRVKYLYTVHQQTFTDRVVDRLLGLWEGY
jgi:predicted transcriptional regulator